MARQRGELVPIGDALSGMSGPREVDPRSRAPARHHFTQTDQVNQLARPAKRTPISASWRGCGAMQPAPHNPGNRKEYVRRNGPYKLGMIAGIDNKLPYGNFPRLILAWVSTEAVRTRSRVIVLGPSLAKFMKTLGVYSSGGGNAGIKLRNQMRAALRLHCATVLQRRE